MRKCQWLCLALHHIQTRTWVSQANLDVTAHEAGLGLVQGLLQALRRTELDVAESFRLAVNLILHDPHGSDRALGQKIFNVNRCDVVVEVAKVGSVRWLGREWDLLAIVSRTI